MAGAPWATQCWADWQFHMPTPEACAKGTAWCQAGRSSGVLDGDLQPRAEPGHHEVPVEQPCVDVLEAAGCLHLELRREARAGVEGNFVIWCFRKKNRALQSLYCLSISNPCRFYTKVSSTHPAPVEKYIETKELLESFVSQVLWDAWYSDSLAWWLYFPSQPYFLTGYATLFPLVFHIS